MLEFLYQSFSFRLFFLCVCTILHLFTDFSSTQISLWIRCYSCVFFLLHKRVANMISKMYPNGIYNSFCFVFPSILIAAQLPCCSLLLIYWDSSIILITQKIIGWLAALHREQERCIVINFHILEMLVPNMILLDRGLLVKRKLQNQWFRVVKWKSLFW